MAKTKEQKKALKELDLNKKKKKKLSKPVLIILLAVIVLAAGYGIRYRIRYTSLMVIRII